MITATDIQNWSKPHQMTLGGKQTRLSNNKITISIVGGRTGLYGDFVNDFEVAIIDEETKEFVTRYFVPDLNDDVMAYVPSENLEQLVNKLMKENFQVL